MAKTPKTASKKSRPKKAAAKRSSYSVDKNKKHTVGKVRDLEKANAKLQAAHDVIQREYTNEVKRLEEKEKQLLNRLAKLDEEKQKIAAENGDVDVSDDDLIEINAGGKIVAAKRGTLTQMEGTKLEALFSGRWDNKLLRDNRGRILLDVNGDCFQAIVDYLNESIISSEDEPPEPPAVADENRHILNCQTELLMKSNGINDIDSDIIKSENDLKALYGWLAEDDSGGKLKLLYRSSTDDLNNHDFHENCDNKGRTLVLIKTEEGVVGGYTSTSWDQCKEDVESDDKAFLFALSGFGISSPCKMKLKCLNDFALYNSSDYGPYFGKGYNGSDLSVEGSSLRLSMGNGYEAGPSDSLNYGYYDINEMEVFQVSDITPRDPRMKKIASVDKFSENLNEAINEKWKTLQELEAEILSLEISFEDEKHFIESFAFGDAKDVIILNVSGTTMATTRATLQFAEESVLAQQFDDTKWTEKGCNNVQVEEWTPDEAGQWVREIKDVPDEVADLFIENEIKGSELLALDRDGLKEIGVKRAGTICLLLKEIKKLEKDSQDVVTLIEHSPYCFGKILDYLRLRHLHSQNLIENEPALPLVRVDQEKRFKKVVKYYFPGKSSEFILGSK
jgi:hypothetical protein